MNARKPRERNGRTFRDRWSRVIHALEVWAWWYLHQDERGWPRESSEVRAFYAAQTASNARERDNSVRQGVGIPQCKETPRKGRSVVPRIDLSRRGPWIDRLLQDMEADGKKDLAQVLRFYAVIPHREDRDVARRVGMEPKTFSRLKIRGFTDLDRRISQLTARTEGL